MDCISVASFNVCKVPAIIIKSLERFDRLAVQLAEKNCKVNIRRIEGGFVGHFVNLIGLTGEKRLAPAWGFLSDSALCSSPCF